MNLYYISAKPTETVISSYTFKLSNPAFITAFSCMLPFLPCASLEYNLKPVSILNERHLTSTALTGPTENL